MEISSGRRILSSSVLVLNRFYMPVHVATVRRAFVLLYREIAEVIHVEDGQFANYDFPTWCKLSQVLLDGTPHRDRIAAVDFQIQVPRVVRLTQFDRMPRQTLRFTRRNLFARDGNCCQYCGISLPLSQLSVDHVVPRSRGGRTEWENVVCSCVKCNTKKGGRTPQEARMKLIQPPRRPKHNPLLALKLNNPKYASWRSFVPNEAKNALAR